MKRFFITFLIFLLPFIIIFSAYIVFDPFMVIKHYDTFYDRNAKGRVVLDKDYMSTATFDNNYRKEHYNSFIFGSSRSFFYQVSEWKKHLQGQSNCYHFDAYGESLYALYKKIKYIDSKDVKIKNALLIFDNELLAQDKAGTDHLFAISPQLEHYRNFFSFHLEFLNAFLSPDFFRAYIDFKLTGKVKPYMYESHSIDDRPIGYDMTTNETRFDTNEYLIAKGNYYTKDILKGFGTLKRDTVQKYSPIAIEENQKIMLREIYDIFKKHKTDYRIVISPLWDQIKLNRQDLDYLIKLFGKENVFDFSGINKFTNNYTNYYERKHYRPIIANEIMTILYQNNNDTSK